MNRGIPGAVGAPGRGEVLFRVEGLTKEFRLGGKVIRVLKGIDLEIRAGETVAILGVSGVGKSTFLHLLGALDRPTAGRILYCGEDQARRSDKELARFRNREIGFVFQFHYLLADLTALENTMLPALIGGLGAREAEERAVALLEELGLGDRLDHRPGMLSGGEQQRVAVARAVIMKPRIILADEPTGNLDTLSAGAVEDLLVGLREKLGVTLLTVTHNPAFAARMDRRIRMVDGRLTEMEPDGEERGGGPEA